MDTTKMASKVFVGILAVSFGAALMKAGLRNFADVLMPVINQLEVTKK